MHVGRDRVPEVIGAWMKLAFKACSRVGVSFGFYELQNIATALAPEFTKIHPEENSKNEVLERMVSGALHHIIRDGADLDTPGLHFAAMAISGARGKLEQIRQIVAARGDLSPGVVGFKSNLNNFYFSRSLVDGLSVEDAFWAAMNARSSMCDKKLGTGHAGALTRELIFALWPFKIVCGDCGAVSSPRSVITCQAKDGCCAACYGLLPDGHNPLNGLRFVARQHGGVVFLDEIGEANAVLQAKLLACLDDYRVRPRKWKGDPFYCPTLIVAATNRDLNKMAKNGEFREDLLARFTDHHIIPPLRERMEDMNFILDCLIQSAGINPEARVTEIGCEAVMAIVSRIQNHAFKGNFRELETIMRAACQAAAKDGRDFICIQDVPECYAPI